MRPSWKTWGHLQHPLLATLGTEGSPVACCRPSQPPVGHRWEADQSTVCSGSRPWTSPRGLHLTQKRPCPFGQACGDAPGTRPRRVGAPSTPQPSPCPLARGDKPGRGHQPLAPALLPGGFGPVLWEPPLARHRDGDPRPEQLLPATISWPGSPVPRQGAPGAAPRPDPSRSSTEPGGAPRRLPRAGPAAPRPHSALHPLLWVGRGDGG